MSFDPISESRRDELRERLLTNHGERSKWAQSNGVPVSSLNSVLLTTTQCTRGTVFKVAVLLGLREEPKEAMPKPVLDHTMAAALTSEQRLIFVNAQFEKYGVSKIEWAKEQGFEVNAVYRTLHHRTGHFSDDLTRIAVALGLIHPSPSATVQQREVCQTSSGEGS